MEEDVNIELMEENELLEKEKKRGVAYEIEERESSVEGEDDQRSESEDDKEEKGHEERKFKPDELDLNPDEKIEEQGAGVDCDYVKRNGEKEKRI